MSRAPPGASILKLMDIFFQTSKKLGLHENTGRLIGEGPCKMSKTKPRGHTKVRRRARNETCSFNHPRVWDDGFGMRMSPRPVCLTAKRQLPPPRSPVVKRGVATSMQKDPPPRFETQIWIGECLGWPRADRGCRRWQTPPKRERPNGRGNEMFIGPAQIGRGQMVLLGQPLHVAHKLHLRHGGRQSQGGLSSEGGTPVKSSAKVLTRWFGAFRFFAHPCVE